MSDTTTATKQPKTRKPNVGSDASKGSRVKQWQVGVYVFAIGSSSLLLGMNLLYIVNGRFSRVFAGLAVLVAGLSWTLVTAKTNSSTSPTGIRVTQVEPALHAFVQAVADEVGGVMPDEIYLVTPAEIALTEDTRFFGLKVDASALTIGLPYLQALTKQEFAMTLAHSFGHHVDAGINEGARAFRGLRAARDLISVERQGFINGVYGSYARKMFRSVGGVAVAQEESADRLAVDTYGTDAVVSALQKYEEIPVAFDQMLRTYVVPALQNKMHPADMFGGFGELMKSPTRAEERSRKVEKRRENERIEFDLHLNPTERIALVQGWEHTAGSVRVDDADASAATLLDPTAKSAEISVATWANDLMTHRTEPYSWQHLTDEIYSVKTQTVASMVFDEEIDPAIQLDRALDWSAAGDWARVDGTMEACMKKMKDPVARRTKWARCVVVEAASATGVFSWQHSWDGPPILVDATGDSLDAANIATLMVEGKADEARAAFDTAVTSKTR